MRTYLILILAGLALTACDPTGAPAAGGGWVYSPSGAGSATRGGPVVSRHQTSTGTGPGTILR